MGGWGGRETEGSVSRDNNNDLNILYQDTNDYKRKSHGTRT